MVDTWRSEICSALIILGLIGPHPPASVIYIFSHEDIFIDYVDNLVLYICAKHHNYFPLYILDFLVRTSEKE